MLITVSSMFRKRNGYGSGRPGEAEFHRTQTALLPTKVQMKAQLPPKRVTASAQRWPRVRVSGACMREASHGCAQWVKWRSHR